MTRLNDSLNDVSRARFWQQARLTTAFLTLAKHVAADTGMSASDIVTAQLNALVSMVQAMSEPSEWDDVGAQLAISIRSRMTIKGETH